MEGGGVAEPHEQPTLQSLVRANGQVGQQTSMAEQYTRTLQFLA
jgi:hypothetical protein